MSALPSVPRSWTLKNSRKNRDAEEPTPQGGELREKEVRGSRLEEEQGPAMEVIRHSFPLDSGPSQISRPISRPCVSFPLPSSSTPLLRKRTKSPLIARPTMKSSLGPPLVSWVPFPGSAFERQLKESAQRRVDFMSGKVESRALDSLGPPCLGRGATRGARKGKSSVCRNRSYLQTLRRCCSCNLETRKFLEKENEKSWKTERPGLRNKFLREQRGEAYVRALGQMSLTSVPLKSPPLPVTVLRRIYGDREALRTQGGLRGDQEEEQGQTLPLNVLVRPRTAPWIF